MTADPQCSRRNWFYPIVTAVVVVAAVYLLFVVGRPTASPDALVVYCAHDSVYSDEILKDFERQTGIPVAIKFDLEATKSLGLVRLLIEEKDNPRCDVFWNNQVLSTMELKEQGVLSPYKGPGHERIPAAFKDPDGHWTGFGARLRVYIVNTDKMEATEAAIATRLEGDLSRTAIAKPLFGTTLTHYSVLWHEWGAEKLQSWHRETRQRGLQEVPGNAAVKNLVAAGACDFGWTDTDDFFQAKDQGLPVAMVPVRVAEAHGATISIPNSAAIIQGTKKREQAERLVDFLLSEQTELALAASKARQVPLGRVDESRLTDEVRQLNQWVDESYDLKPLGPAHSECLQWLKSEYLQ